MDGVSVVIPCLNEEKYISSCLDSLINNGFNHEKLEILVVDGGSTDTTLSIVLTYQKSLPFIKLVHNINRKTPFALNLGVKNALFNKVLIAGAHANYPKNYIKELYTHLNSNNIDIIGGAIETKAKNQNEKAKAICFVLSHRFGVGNSIFRIGADELLQVDTVPFGLYNKEIFDKVGYYNEELIRNHDMELSSRIKAGGYNIWMDPKLKCTYYARETFNGLAKNNYGNGLWNIKTLFITKKFSSLGLRHYIPMLFIMSLLLPVLIGVLWNSYVSLFSLLSLLLYISLIVMVGLKAKNQNSMYVIWAFACLHFSYGWGSCVGIFSLKKRVAA